MNQDNYEAHLDELESQSAAWHKIDIRADVSLGLKAAQLVTIHHSTNDDEDRGFPSKSASWTNTQNSLAAALKHTGKTRQGIGCRVEVSVNGVPYHGQELRDPFQGNDTLADLARGYRNAMAAGDYKLAAVCIASAHATAHFVGITIVPVIQKMITPIPENDDDSA